MKSPETVALQKAMGDTARVAALRAALKGKKQDPEFVKRRTAKMKGRIVSEETKAKLKAATGTPEERAARSARMKARHAAGKVGLNQVFKDTVPELAVQKWLDDRDIGYEKHSVIWGREWDLVITGRRILIEVDGCYWHGCVECGYGHINDKRELDASKDGLARDNGWTLIRVPEHAVKCLDEVLSWICC